MAASPAGKVGPAAQHIVAIRFEPDRTGPDLASGELAEPVVHEFLLPLLDLVHCRQAIGVGDPDRRLHCLQRAEQLRVFELRLVDQYIDADRLGAHLVDVGQRAGEDRPVERRSLGGRSQRILRIGDQDDALVLRDRAVP